jgi:hypothetical protein
MWILNDDGCSMIVNQLFAYKSSGKSIANLGWGVLFVLFCNVFRAWSKYIYACMGLVWEVLSRHPPGMSGLDFGLLVLLL